MPITLFHFVLFGFLIVYLFAFMEGDSPDGLTHPFGDEIGKDRGH